METPHLHCLHPVGSLSSSPSFSVWWMGLFRQSAPPYLFHPSCVGRQEMSSSLTLARPTMTCSRCVTRSPHLSLPNCWRPQTLKMPSVSAGMGSPLMRGHVINHRPFPLHIFSADFQRFGVKKVKKRDKGKGKAKTSVLAKRRARGNQGRMSWVNSSDREQVCVCVEWHVEVFQWSLYRLVNVACLGVCGGCCCFGLCVWWCSHDTTFLGSLIRWRKRPQQKIGTLPLPGTFGPSSGMIPTLCLLFLLLLSSGGRERVFNGVCYVFWSRHESLARRMVPAVEVWFCPFIRPFWPYELFFLVVSIFYLCALSLCVCRFVRVSVCGCSCVLVPVLVWVLNRRIVVHHVKYLVCVCIYYRHTCLHCTCFL